MDIQMPIMNDIESKNELRKLELEQPIVALTPHSTKESVNDSVIARSDGYTPKSITLKALKNALLTSRGDNHQ